MAHGTALLNESVEESWHADVDNHYRGYIVKELNAASYPSKLLQAVKVYNACHI